jgi:hypothetical protein
MPGQVRVGGGNVASAQVSQGKQALGGCGVRIGAEVQGGRQGCAALTGCVCRPTDGQVDAAAQKAQGWLGRNVVQARIADDAEDASSFAELAEVDKNAGECEERLCPAGIRCGRAVVTRSIAEKINGLAGTALVPGNERARDHRRHCDVAAVTAGSS